MTLTIVLTLKGRDEFTYRWMSYMNDIKCPYHIIIADGGDGLEIYNKLSKHENYPNLNYQYLRYPFDANLNLFYEKLIDALSKVTSKYVLLADNDDFYKISEIPKLLDFLDSNSEYAAARGFVTNFKVLDENRCSIGTVKGVKYYAHVTSSPSIDENSSLDRIGFLCENMSNFDYYANWYSIVKSESLLKIWNQLIKLRVRDPLVLEMLLNILLVQEGKLKVFAFPFYLRQMNTSSFGDALVADNNFLENCLITNSLSDFSFAVENFMNLEHKELELVVLKHIATWMEVLLTNIRNANREQKRKLNKFKEFLNRLKFISSLVNYLYSYLRVLIRGIPRQKRVRISEIEPYILNG
jgi:glycosyltransferase domain-containing protein